MDFQQEEMTSLWKKDLENYLGKKISLNQIGIVSGGSISQAYKIHTSEGAFFVKTNQVESFPGMFDSESKGLQFLIDNSQFNIPKPIANGSKDDTQWILMNFIQPSPKSKDFWITFGAQLAGLHRNNQDSFGLEYNNYFGSLKQVNTQHSDWNSFFIQNRIEPQLKLAIDAGKLRPEMAKRSNRLFRKLDSLLPKEAPAALHGDLWSGNFMTDNQGNATIFDPAVYYGHREVDIAMTKLFGSFDDQFYNSYNNQFPLEAGWEERVDIFNLYPLLAHVNLFGGGSYATQVISIFRSLA